ncbi:hypothetical protein [Burkholderia pyrrocinia]|uniref:hypothetical protein n=1 Tax=Burkholderia pyrrocinia TaxID=60550 RepID=UPI001374CA33|nr:hypothetical protein [Burkholderia pyrrocinia]
MGENVDFALVSSGRVRNGVSRFGARADRAVAASGNIRCTERFGEENESRSAMRATHDCFMGGVANTRMLDVIAIARSTITAAAVDLCVTLSFDAARATVPPINDHDSVRPAINAIALPHRGMRSPIGQRSLHCDGDGYLGQ